MMRIKLADITAALCLVIACSGYAQSSSNSKKAADYATKWLEQALGGGSANVKTAKGGTEPNWVKDPYAAYSRDRYLAARGFASTQGEAEKKALVYIERKKAIAVYSEMICINQINIENLTALNASEKNTFDGYARYKLAALIAGLNSQYAAVIVQSGGSTGSLNMTSASSLNIEAENIIKNITVAVNVKGDKNNRIKDAFSKKQCTDI